MSNKNDPIERDTARKTVLIAGATGYAGRHLVQEYSARHPTWRIQALVRRPAQKLFPDGVEVVMAEATRPETLDFHGVDIVVSALGITRQRDGLTYKDVDYQANMNLLQEAISKGVQQFGYIHVLNGQELAREKGVAAVQAKQDFVDELVQEKSRIRPTIVCPSGFFSDMQDFLDMAQSGRVWLFGDGHYRINPIHGADLAKATVDAMEKDQMQQLDVGGPDIYTQTELAQLAVKCSFPGEDDTNKKISHVWDGVRKFLLAVVPWVTPLSLYGPVQFFLAAMGMDGVGVCVGTHHLEDFWRAKLKEKQ